VGGQAPQKKVGFLCPCGPLGSATYGHCHCSILWSFNVFINDFSINFRRVKNQSCQVTV